MGKQKISGRVRRKRRVRKKIQGTPERPRLTVFRSLKHIHAQIIDDTSGRTLASASTAEKESGLRGSNISAAKDVGARLAKRAKAAKIEALVFDRNGYIFHGRVKALADAVREEGLRF